MSKYSLRTQDTRTCTNAAARGDLNRLKWARANGCPWDSTTHYVAKIHGHVKVVKWLEKNGCPTSGSREVHYKIIGNNFGNYPYRIGLNTLKHNGEVFNPIPECGQGGLYFCEVTDILQWINYGHTLCVVEIPEDAQVVQLRRKAKADKIIILDMLPLDDVNTWKYLVKQGLNIHGEGGAIWDWANYSVKRKNILKYLRS